MPNNNMEKSKHIDVDSTATVSGSESGSVIENQYNKTPTDLNDSLLFKKRDIKCKNIRKIDTDDVKLYAIEESVGKDSRTSKTPEKKNPKKYPINWAQYKELNLDPDKDAYLKSKLFRKSSSLEKQFSLKKYFNFEVPSSPIEPYNYRALNGDLQKVPFQYLRSTEATPTIFYNTNINRTSPGYLTKEQLYSFISPEIKKSIEQLWFTQTTRLSSERQKISQQKWFPRYWKNLGNSEAKLLETSLGLAFLQDYSDSEDQEREQHLVNNSTTDRHDNEKDCGKTIVNSNNKFEAESDSKLTSEQSAMQTDQVASNQSLDGIEIDHIKSVKRHNNKKKDLSSSSSDSSMSSSSSRKRKKKKKSKKKSKPRNNEITNHSDNELSESERKISKKKSKKDRRDKGEKKTRKKKRKEKKDKELKLIKKDLEQNQPKEPSVNKRNVQIFSKNDFLLNSSLDTKMENVSNKSIDFKLINLEELTQHSQEINELSKKIEKYNQLLLEETKTKKQAIESDKLRVPEIISEIKINDLDGSGNISVNNAKSEEQSDNKYDENLMSHQFEVNLDDIRLPSTTPPPTPHPHPTNDINKETDLTNNHFESDINVQNDEFQSCNSSSDNDIRRHPDWKHIKIKRKKHISQRKMSNDNGDANLLLPIIEIKKEIIDLNNHTDDNQAQHVTNSPVVNMLNHKESILKKLNTSWDSDEEFFNTKDFPSVRILNTTEKIKERKDTTVNLSNLEIPLNLKHFTRREVIKVDPDAFDIDLNVNVNKKGKAAKKNQLTDNSTIIKTEKLDDDNDDKANDSIKLENEYEEFLKAVTSSEVNTSTETTTATSSLCVEDVKMNHDNDCDNLESAVLENKPFLDIPVIQIPLPPPPSSSELAPPLLSSSAPTLSLQLPLIPPPPLAAPAAQTKSEPTASEPPVPVPSPLLETVIDLNNKKPSTINLSLSANVTQNITLSLATTGTNLTTPITSTIDISKPNVEITPSFFANEQQQQQPEVSVQKQRFNEIHVDGNNWLTTTAQDNVINNNNNNSSLPVDGVGVEQMNNGINSLESTSTNDIEKPQKIVFTTITLPTKKTLINNSILDDSDNEEYNESVKKFKLKTLIENNERESILIKNNRTTEHDDLRYDKSRSSRADLSPISSATTRQRSRRHSPTPSPLPSSNSTSRRLRSPTLSPPRRSRRLSPSSSSASHRSSSRRLSPYGSSKRQSFHRSKRSPTPILKRRRSSISPVGTMRRRMKSYSRSPPPPSTSSSSSRRSRRSISPKERSSGQKRYRSRSPARIKRKRCLSPSPSPSPPLPPLPSSSRPKKYDDDRSLSPLPLTSSSSYPTQSSYAATADTKLDQSLLEPTSAEREASSNTQYDQYNNIEHVHNDNYNSPKRISLDDRINQVLNYEQQSVPYNNSVDEFSHHYPIENQQQQMYQYDENMMVYQHYNMENYHAKKSCYKQVGNMLQIVPNEHIPEISSGAEGHQCIVGADATNAVKMESMQEDYLAQYQNCYGSTNIDTKSQILQVGNMLHIVPQDNVSSTIIPPPPPPPLPSSLSQQQQHSTHLAQTNTGYESLLIMEKQSTEAIILQKLAEQRMERQQRQEEKEQRRIERQMKKIEREKKRQEKLKLKTESLIKKALEMEQMEDDLTSDLDQSITIQEKPAQWPPLPSSLNAAHHQKEAGKSILITNSSRKFDELIFGEKKPKAVLFADGIKPGEGTSPSGGEELSSPAPFLKKKLPKDKLYKRIKKSGKKKIKVRVVKKPITMQSDDDDDSDENLPPLPPPSGSPPPHIFPPRIKPNMKHNIPPSMISILIPQGPKKPPIIIKQAEHQWRPDLYPNVIVPTSLQHHKPYQTAVAPTGLMMRPRLPLSLPPRLPMTPSQIPPSSRKILLSNLPPPPPPPPGHSRPSSAATHPSQMQQPFPSVGLSPLPPINANSSTSNIINNSGNLLKRSFSSSPSLGQGQTLHHSSAHHFTR